MAHYAILDENNIVIQVIKGIDETDTSQDWEEFYGNQLNGVCKRTSFNTSGGKYYDSETEKIITEKAFRKNYAGIGFTYDENRDAFIPPKPFNSWVLNEETCLWESTIEHPNDGKPYNWNEDLMQWDLYTPQQPFGSWTWNETEWKWEAPIPYPNDGQDYIWNEETLSWDLVE